MSFGVVDSGHNQFHQVDNDKRPEVIRNSQEMDPRQQRIDRNRKSALRSRQRKLDHRDQLQQLVADLRTQNAKIRSDIESMKGSIPGYESSLRSSEYQKHWSALSSEPAAFISSS